MTRTLFSKDKHIREECERAVAHGWTYRTGGNNHWQLYTPSGRYRLTVPMTASETHCIHNFRAQLRRFGEMDKQHVAQRQH